MKNLFEKIAEVFVPFVFFEMLSFLMVVFILTVSSFVLWDSTTFFRFLMAGIRVGAVVGLIIWLCFLVDEYLY